MKHLSCWSLAGRVAAALLCVAAFTAPAQAAKKKRAPKKGAPAASAPAAPGESEPELPKKQNEPIFCSVPDEALAGAEVKFRCAPRGDVKANGMRLQYRTTSPTFTAVTMEKSSQGGWWVGVLAPGVVQGKSLQYYVEAVNTAGDPLAANGREDSPNVIYIKNVAPPPVTAVAQIPAQQALPRMGNRRLKSYWLGFSMGTGFGWHAADNLEYRGDLKVAAGTGPAGPIHLAPEIGYQATERFAFSIQGRHQIIPADGDDPGRTGHPAGGAHLILMRGHWYAINSNNVHVYGTGIFAVGEGMRITYAQGNPAGTRTNDTVRVGPVALGPGGGVVWDFTESLAVGAEVNVLFGIPSIGVVTDFHAGLQYKL